MRVLQVFAASLGAFFLASCSTLLPQTEFAMSYRTDPYLWLEDVEGERAAAIVDDLRASALHRAVG